MPIRSVNLSLVRSIMPFAFATAAFVSSTPEPSLWQLAYVDVMFETVLITISLERASSSCETVKATSGCSREYRAIASTTTAEAALDADLDRLLPLRREYLHGIFCFIERTHRLGCMLLEEEPFFGQTNIATLSYYERYP